MHGCWDPLCQQEKGAMLIALRRMLRPVFLPHRLKLTDLACGELPLKCISSLCFASQAWPGIKTSAGSNDSAQIQCPAAAGHVGRASVCRGNPERPSITAAKRRAMPVSGTLAYCRAAGEANLCSHAKHAFALSLTARHFSVIQSAERLLGS